MLCILGNWDLPLDDLLEDFILNYDTSPYFSFDMKQSELGCVFTLVLAGALGSYIQYRYRNTYRDETNVKLGICCFDCNAGDALGFAHS